MVENDALTAEANVSSGGDPSGDNNKQNQNMIPKERFDEINAKYKDLAEQNQQLNNLYVQLQDISRRNPVAMKKLLQGENLDEVFTKQVQKEQDTPLDLDSIDAVKNVYDTITKQIADLNRKIDTNTEKVGKALLQQHGSTLTETFDEAFDKLGYNEKSLGAQKYNKIKNYYKTNMQSEAGRIMQSGRQPTKRDVISAVNTYHEDLSKIGEDKEKERVTQLKKDAEQRGGKTFVDTTMPKGEHPLAGEQEPRPKSQSEARAKLRDSLIAIHSAFDK